MHKHYSIWEQRSVHRASHNVHSVHYKQPVMLDRPSVLTNYLRKRSPPPCQHDSLGLVSITTQLAWSWYSVVRTLYGHGYGAYQNSKMPQWQLSSMVSFGMYSHITN